MSAPPTEQHQQMLQPGSMSEDLKPQRGWERLRSGTFGSRVAVIGVWLLLTVFYSILNPDTFFTIGTFQTIFGSQQALVFLTAALLCTICVGEFVDLSVASVLGLVAVLVPVLVVNHGWNVWLASVAAIAVSGLCGAINGFLAVKVGVNTIVVTLGMGTLLLGIALWISNLTAVTGLERGVSEISLHPVGGLPISFYEGAAVMVGMAYVLACTPLGRNIRFVGSNREVSRLAGIHVARIRMGAFIAAGLICGVGGVLTTAATGGFDPTVSQSYLLPTFAATFLGTAGRERSSTSSRVPCRPRRSPEPRMPVAVAGVPGSDGDKKVVHVDRFTLMRSFVGVAEHGSFVYAARNLGMSGSLVSRHVAQLEKDLGTRLLNRTARTVTLTTAGRRYADFAHRIIDELDAEDAALRGMQEKAEGPLAVICPKWIGNLDLGEAIADFAVDHPKIYVRFEVGGMSDRTFDFLDRGYDVAFHTRDLRDSTLLIRKVADLDFILCASETYLQRCPRLEDSADLTEHDCLVHINDPIWNLRRDGEETHVKVLNTVYSYNSYLTLRKAAVRGRGVALMPARR